MTSENPLISLGELSKPATVLIEKISDAVGGVFRPYQIVRVAYAEAKAEIIKAQTQLEISDLQRRALQRFVIEEEKRQEIIENIAYNAAKLVKDDSKPENIDDDWITNFFDKCRIVSDTEMQQLWIQILADEANNIGSFSKRTVNMLASMDKRDAILFTKLCSFSWNIDEPTPLIYDSKNEIYVKNGINFESLKHLAYIGLIDYETLTSFKRIGFPQLIMISYFDNTLFVNLNGNDVFELQTGQVIFTKMGKELAKVCRAQPIPEFFEYIKSILLEMGHTIQNVHRIFVQ